MFLRDPRGQVRDLRVQWADEGEVPSPLARSNLVDHVLFSEDDEDDSSAGEGHAETWSTPPRQASPRQPFSLLGQTLPTSPPDQSYWRERSIRDDDSEESEDWRYNDDYSTSGASESTYNETCSADSIETATSDRKIVGERLLAAVTNERAIWGKRGDEALVTAPVHAWSSTLPPVFSPVRLHEQACKAHLLADSSVSNTSEVWDDRRSGYSVTSAFAPPGLRPRPFAMPRPQSSASRFTPSTRHRYHHSSTAVHEPRARCGCRGLTVRVDSGLLGLSLEATCLIEHGFVLKQAWSDCPTDRGVFSHSVHVKKMSNGKCTGHGSGASDLRFESRSLSSGLIRVRAIDPGSGDPPTAPLWNSGNSPLVGSPPPLRPGALSAKDARRMRFAGVLEVEEGDILVRVDDVQVTKKSFRDVTGLLERAERPTRLTFVRHACGRRFVGWEKGRGRFRCAITPSTRTESPRRSGLVDGWGGCCGKWGKSGCGCEHPLGAACIGPQPSNPSLRTPIKPDGCPVAVLLRSRRQLRSGGMEQWHEVVASRGQLWQKLLKVLSPDSHSDREKLRKLTGCARMLDRHPLHGKTGISKRKLTNNFQRLINGRKAVRNGGGADGSAQIIRALSARVWKDVNRVMSPRRPGERPGFFSASQHGGGGHVCPAHFEGGSKDAVFRVAYATASTLQFVSGISYMAALVLVQEPAEAMAYATLVTLLQEQVMQALFPLGDVDLLDAYHLSGGKVVTFREFGAARSPTSCEAAASDADCDGQYQSSRDHGNRCTAGGEVSADGVSVGLAYDNVDAVGCDGDDGDSAAGRGMGKRIEEPTQQVVVGDMLPRLVRMFGKALKRRLPALHSHLCKQAIPMSFLCAEWFTTAYARNTPLPLALCAFDLFLVRLDDVMLRLGLAILEVLAPSLKALNGLEILLQYGGLAANVCFEEVLRCALATQ
ncbi:unnamed protein product, partial [Scytosiphon promiscuus]